MPLGTLDRTPPPFFRQGPSALTKLFFFSALALFLMVADTRFKLAEPVRATMATALLPVQRALAVPVGLAERSSDYLQGLDSSLSKVRDTEARLVRQAERNARMDQIQAENQRLRGLLDLRPAVSVRSRAAEVLFEAADPFSRKVVIDTGACPRGSRWGRR
jgi:rod shape-determining protein MreC